MNVKIVTRSLTATGIWGVGQHLAFEAEAMRQLLFRINLMWVGWHLRIWKKNIFIFMAIAERKKTPIYMKTLTIYLLLAFSRTWKENCQMMIWHARKKLHTMQAVRLCETLSGHT